MLFFYSFRSNEFEFFSRKEAEELKTEVTKWRVAEATAREQLLSITQLNQSIAFNNATTHAQHNLVQSTPPTSPQAQTTTTTRTLSPPPYRPMGRTQETNSVDERSVLSIIEN